MNNILIVEDDKDLLEALKITLQNAGFNVDFALSAESALQQMKEKHFQVVVSDINLGKTNGLELLANIKKNFYTVAVILMTAYGKISDAVMAIQSGAMDYITKPFDAEQLICKINQVIKPVTTSDNIVHLDDKTKQLIGLASQVAGSDASVLISGESGTGKEIFAKFIHDNSVRKDNPFVAINCAAIPDNMLEAILFGYEKGAFTGAYQTTEGKLEQGNLGTILLDEISEMPLTLQAKLLRVLQEREVERLGGKKLIKLDIRIIATTNRVLSKEIEAGNFRQDLYFRLNVFPLHIPPLRQRQADIIPLSEYFVGKYAQGILVELSLSAKTKLLSHSWPGNIRELQNVIQRAIIFSNGNAITENHIIFDEKAVAIEEATSSHLELAEQLTDKENDLILKVLEESKGNRNICAEKLGISARTLRNKLSRMKKMGIALP
ncbi:MAG: hypothetical protein BGO43_11145 [Gammaproteobacteria bacterium 39-13]|nr:sigma-54-dependent Fis family transcriptional regulator [Gammaproteobacteria bacterium]OJV86593.1 MAG: hypothetical protein BGO43_11145 [Gammaproteobacteria bacterium 39-13]